MPLRVKVRDLSFSARDGYTYISVRDGYTYISIRDLAARWAMILRGKHTSAASKCTSLVRAESSELVKLYTSASNGLDSQGLEQLEVQRVRSNRGKSSHLGLQVIQLHFFRVRPHSTRGGASLGDCGHLARYTLPWLI